MAKKGPVPDRQLKAISRGSAIVIPLCLTAAVVYGTYVLTVRICVDYLLHPSPELRHLGIRPRKGAAIALLVIYFLLLPLMALSYLRILQVAWTDPGYIKRHEDPEKTSSSKEYDRLDAFICDFQGNPTWCEKCNNWKPDRAHHCSELGRCVRRMDHFCPWAGGIISQNNHKFFVQFCFYGALYNGFLVVVSAVFMAERVKKVSEANTYWVVALALSGLFFLFSSGMVMSSLDLAFRNLTTIENLNKGNAVFNIAIFTRTISDQESLESSSPPRDLTQGPPGYRHPPPQTVVRGKREFRIIQTSAGENPWDLGPWRNFKSLMGYTVWDWFLPIKRSPFTRRGRRRSIYEFGHVLDRLKRESRITRSS